MILKNMFFLFIITELQKIVQVQTISLNLSNILSFLDTEKISMRKLIIKLFFI